MSKNSHNRVITLTCPDCHSPFEAKYGYYVSRRNKGFQLRCKICTERHKSHTLREKCSSRTDEEKSRISKNKSVGIKKYWENISEEERNQRADAVRKHIQSLPKEELDRRMVSLNKAKKRYWGNLTENEKLIQIQKLRINNEEWWANMTDEDLEEFRQKVKSVRENMSDVDKRRWFTKLSVSGKLRWKNMNEAEYNDWNLKRSVGQALANTKIRDTENDFKSLLHSKQLPYEFQYRSTTIHPDFHKLFKVNPSGVSKYISPYHVWDFLIYTKTGKVLVDIDGSHHTIPPGKFIINGRDIGLNGRFKDSQRPYQTDGLDAYVILAYNDKLDLETPVISLKYPGDKMNVKYLLSLLTFNPKRKGKKGR